MSANGMTPAEPEQPKILSLKEVLETAEEAKIPGGAWDRRFVSRLCATAQHYANDLAIARALYRGVSYCEKCDRCHDSRTGCESDIRQDERKKVGAENDRLSALVAQMRKVLAEALPCVEYCRRDELKRDIESLLDDHAGQHAAEELRLLRAFEHASRDLNWLTLQSDPATHSKAVGARDEAWEALRAFREKTI